MGSVRRRFGNVRQLPSGRWQVRYTAPDGLPRRAPTLFATKTAAQTWLVRTEASVLSGEWLDPRNTSIPFAVYAEQWLRHRPLKARTREGYERLLKTHVLPCFGTTPVGRIGPPQVRSWHSGLVEASVGRSTVAKCYRIVHAIFATAVDDELLRRNPCRMRAAGHDAAVERPTVDIDQVLTLADAIQPRYRLLVLLAAFAQLRFGELIALRRADLDLDRMQLSVVHATIELQDGTRVDGEPKSQAGRRTVMLPESLRSDIEAHLGRYVGRGPDGRLFAGSKGAIPRRSNFNRVWHRALREAGIPPELGLRLHDLRHTGSTWSTQDGATLREVMTRVGHASTRAAMIYQHASQDRDARIAESLNERIVAARTANGDAASGTLLA